MPGAQFSGVQYFGGVDYANSVNDRGELDLAPPDFLTSFEGQAGGPILLPPRTKETLEAALADLQAGGLGLSWRIPDVDPTVPSVGTLTLDPIGGFYSITVQGQGTRTLTPGGLEGLTAGIDLLD